MNIFIVTSNSYKQQELSRYFNEVGLKTISIHPENLSGFSEIEALLISEQTELISKKTQTKALYDVFDEVVHRSEVTLTWIKEGERTLETYRAEVEGFIVPSRKSYRSDIYNWDDIFVVAKTMKSYQEMKDKGIKNSARDLAFMNVIDRCIELFSFEKKANLNFNPMTVDKVISFDPFIYNLFQNNSLYKQAYQNSFFRSLVNYALNQGLFTRRASNRKEKNYWLPGLNAGVPLTPKKDQFHELTFMFHDIMHFIYPDLLVSGRSRIEKEHYIIARMMSEAFTLVLADMLFVHVVKQSGFSYDYNKRKIYPLFESIAFDIDKEHLGEIKKLLWANTCFALLGSEKELRSLIGNQDSIDNYKDKYQRFFQEDYKWTAANYNNMVESIETSQKIASKAHTLGIEVFETQKNIFSNLDTLRERVEKIFESMFAKLTLIVSKEEEYCPEVAYSQAVKRYYTGQMAVFYQIDTAYNNLFEEEICGYLKKDLLTEHDVESVNNMYSLYIDKLIKDGMISRYDGANFKNIYPIFKPFYVFYDSQKNERFNETVATIFEEDKDV